MKLLSRKILASILVFLTATLFVWYGKIDGSEWVKLAIVTVMAYIAGDGISASIKYYMSGKKKSFTIDEYNDNTIRGRLKNMLSPQFLAAVIVYTVATILMWNGKITTTEWNYVAMGTIAGYDLLNPLGKIK